MTEAACLQDELKRLTAVVLAVTDDRSPSGAKSTARWTAPLSKTVRMAGDGGTRAAHGGAEC